MAEYYVFGYDHLILPEGRALIGSTGQVMHVLVDGVERRWAHPIPSMQLTALGATYTGLSTVSCNGVIFSVPERRLQELDATLQGHTRIAIPHERINPIAGQRPSGAVWVYTINNPMQPTKELPIAQSYLDAVLSWTVQNVGEAFARAVIQSTSGWNGSWLNDRENPRYTGHLDYNSPDVQAVVTTIDYLLQQQIPEAFARRIQQRQ